MRFALNNLMDAFSVLFRAQLVKYVIKLIDNFVILSIFSNFFVYYAFLKAFFFRSTEKKLVNTYKCKNRFRCEIEKKNIKECRMCRYNKCVQVGMSAESKSSWLSIYFQRDFNLFNIIFKRLSFRTSASITQTKTSRKPSGSKRRQLFN